MKTDKNNLFRAIGDIDDRFVDEILQEDAAGAVKMTDSQAETLVAAGVMNNVVAMPSVKKKKPIMKYLPYVLPAAAGLLVAFVCIRSFLLVGYDEGASNGPSYSATPSSYSGGEAAAECAEAPSDYATDSVDAEAMQDNGSYGLNFWDSNGVSSATAPSDSGKEATENASVTLGEQEMDMINPFIECNSLKSASGIAGFDFYIPNELMDEYDVNITAIKDTLIQVIFYSEGEEVFRLRKGYVADISGDYTKYEFETVFDGETVSGTLFGHDSENVNTAVWSEGDYTYSLTTAGEPLESSMVSEIIEMVTGD
jgi:hypothetical protein